MEYKPKSPEELKATHEEREKVARTWEQNVGKTVQERGIMGEFDTSKRIFYTESMPRNSERVKKLNELWSPADDSLFKLIKSPQATEEDVIKAQKRLVYLGLLEPEHVDGKRGLITDGAIRRFNHNTTGASGRYHLTEERNKIFDAMKDAGDYIHEKIFGE